MNDETVAEVVEEVVEESVDTDEAWLANRNKELEAKDDDEPEAADSEEVVKAEEEPEPSESSTEKKDDGFQTRIDELTKRYYTEKEQREHFQRQWEDSQTPAPQESGKTLADFDYDESSWMNYQREQMASEVRADIERKAHEQSEFRRRGEFSAKEAKLAESVPDYYNVAHHSPISPEVAGIIMSADKAPELAYYVGKNPELAESLSAMSPLDAARELGRIEVTKLVKPEPLTPKTPAATPKIKAADSTGVRVKADEPKGDDLSDAEWLKRRNKQIASR